jgi:hypothetical protein
MFMTRSARRFWQATFILASVFVTRPASAEPIEVVLTIDPSPVIPATLDFDGDSFLIEQYPGSLQSPVNGTIRVLVDPSNPQTFQFLPGEYTSQMGPLLARTRYVVRRSRLEHQSNKRCDSAGAE